MLTNKWCQSLSILFLMLLLATPSQAQESSEGQLEVYGTYGYFFGGYLRAYNGRIDIRDDDNFKIGLNYTLFPGTQLEVFWLHQASEVTITEYGNIFDFVETFDLNTDYIQIGVLKEFKPGPVRPFGRFTMGSAIFSPQDINYDNLWRFSFTMGAGVKAYLSENIGLRFSGSLMVPVYWAGLNFWCGPGGCSTGVAAGSAMVQGELSAGLFISLGGE